jgi:hypothetical protein
MKRLIYLFLLCIGLQTFAQLNDNFSSSKAEFNTRWIGDTNAFQLIDETLKLNAPLNQNKVNISRCFPDTNSIRLELICSLDFSPSASNRLQLYLTENEDLQNGYYLQIGENGSNDAIDCYRIINGNSNLIISGIAKRIATNFDLLELSFILNDSLQLHSILPGETLKQEFSIIRTDTLKLNCFSITCNYTSTRSTKFTFDDFKITPLEFNPKTSIKEQNTNYYFSKVHDLLFTELMIDPTPKRFLPEAEFIELYNNSDTVVQLKNWTISNGVSTNTLDSFNLLPQQVLVICNKTDVNKFSDYQTVMSIESLVSLSNESFILSLRNPFHHLIHQVIYESDKQYSEKRDGGYTYELFNKKQPCAATSWRYSDNQLGGTIGEIDSFKGESQFPKIQNYQLKEDSLVIVFDIVNMNAPYFSKQKNIVVNNNQIKIDLQTCNSLINDSTIYLGNSYAAGNLIFNEILSAPKESCPEFIELYNDSDNYIRIEKTYLGYSSTTEPEEVIALPDGLIIPPYTYLVLCNDFTQLKTFYDVNSNCVSLEIEHPTLLNSEGTLFLINEFGEIMTSMTYSESQHNELLDNEKGISLERINFISNEWTSGNVTKGGASIGRLNDSHTESLVSKINIISSENHYSFTKNQAITYTLNFTDGDYLGDVLLFDKSGVKIKDLRSNIHFSTDDEIQLNDFSFIQQLGIYIVYFEFRHPENGVIRKRIPLVIVE